MQAYFRYLIGSFLLALFVVGSVSYLFDPLGYFRIHNTRSDSLIGDRVWGDERTIKVLSLSGLRPDSLLLGTSRVMLGFDLNDPDMQQYLGNAYNLGLPGCKVDEIEKLIRYAFEFHVPNNIIIGLDLGEFVVASSVSMPGFMIHGMTYRERAFNMLRRLSFALWSEDALVGIARMGFKAHSGYLNGTGNNVNSETLRNRGAMLQSRRLEKMTAEHLLQNNDQDLYQKSMDTLFQTLKYACANNVRVELFVTPLHIRQLLLLKTTGFQEQFYAWKRGLTNMVEQLKDNRCNIGLVDFSGISKYTTNKLPPAGDLVTSPQWYWESSHFKVSLGNLMVRRMWNDVDVEHDFGVSLNNETIEHEITASREELIQYQKSNPQLAKELQDIVLEVSKTIEY